MTQTDADITARGEGEVGDTDHQSRESQGDTCEWETWGDAEPDDHDCCSPKPGIHFFCLSSLVSLTILMTVLSLTILTFSYFLSVLRRSTVWSCILCQNQVIWSV